MSSLLTQVIRRQALTMMPRRRETYLAGPPLVKLTTQVNENLIFRR